MESFGNILKQKRDDLGIPMERIERETSISREYLVAIEEERVDYFPGETYFIGFMRIVFITIMQERPCGAARAKA